MFRGRGLIELEQCSKQGFPSGSDGKESTTMQEIQVGSPALGRSPGEGNGNPLQYSCLENPHGQRSLAGYSPWVQKESDTTEQLSTAQHTIILTLHEERKRKDIVN